MKAVVPVGGWARLLSDQGLAHFLPGEETVLELDTSKAGPGQLQSEILTQYGEVKNYVEPLNEHRLLLRFTPRDPVQHNLVLRWNGKPLGRSPIKLMPTSSGVAATSTPNNAVAAVADTARSKRP